MNTLAKYIQQINKEYNLRIKTIAKLDDDKIDRIENCLKKYRLIDMTNPSKSIIHAHPLDFSGVDHGEVYTIDIITGLPVSTHILQQELKDILNIPDRYVVVKNENDPLEVETEKLNAIEEINDKAKGMKPGALLDTDSEYKKFEQGKGKPGSEFYGNEYNSKFLSYLSNIASSRKSSTVETNSENSEPAMFNWMSKKPENDKPKEKQSAVNTTIGDDFNKDIKDAPKPYPKWLQNSDKMDNQELISREGNYDNDVMTYAKPFRDKNGKERIIQADTKSIRKKK